MQIASLVRYYPWYIERPIRGQRNTQIVQGKDHLYRSNTHLHRQVKGEFLWLVKVFNSAVLKVLWPCLSRAAITVCYRKVAF